MWDVEELTFLKIKIWFHIISDLGCTNIIIAEKIAQYTLSHTNFTCTKYLIYNLFFKQTLSINWQWISLAYEYGYTGGWITMYYILFFCKDN